MTGIHLIIALATISLAVGFGLLIWGKDRGSGTVKAFGIELAGTSPLLLLALGGGLIVFLVVAPPKFNACLVVAWHLIVRMRSFRSE